MNPQEIKALVAKWQPVLDQAAYIFSWTEPECLAYCAEVASRATMGIEVGSYMGKSAFVMLKANPKLKLFCVDLFRKGVVGTLECCQYFLRDEVAQKRVEFISDTSHKGAKIIGEWFAEHRKALADFAWIDGGHDTNTVLGDIQAYLPLLRPGGELFGHDFDSVPVLNDVALGVIASGIDYSVPVPRLWSHIKP